jgi:hypothetical protein
MNRLPKDFGNFYKTCAFSALLRYQKGVKKVYLGKGWLRCFPAPTH